MDTKSKPDPVAARLDELAAQVAYLVERQRKTEELFAEMTPILREVMATAITRLDDLEKRGWFERGREAVELGARLLDELKGAGGAKPIGVVGAMRAARKPEVQKGLGVVMELLAAVGRSVDGAPKPQVDAGADRRAKLAAVLGPRRQRPLALPAHREAPRPVAPVAEAPVNGAWTRELAVQLAAAEGITLGPDHWRLVEVARTEYERTKVAANIRRLTQIAGVSTKDIYTLFPKAPGRTIARIAGTPKPAGCI